MSLRITLMFFDGWNTLRQYVKIQSVGVRCFAFCPVICTSGLYIILHGLYITLPVCTLHFLSAYFTSGLHITLPVRRPLHYTSGRPAHCTSCLHIILPVYTLHFLSAHYTSGLYITRDVLSVGLHYPLWFSSFSRMSGGYTIRINMPTFQSD